MTERLYYIGDSGPFYYDDSGTAGAEGGTLSGENLQALLAEGSIKIGVSGVNAGHLMRRDDIESSIAAGAAASVSDAAYGAGWNGVTTVAPSKNAVYDKINSLSSSDKYVFDVEDYGAGTGASAATNTTAFQNAINAAEAAGGGIVLFGRGSYQFTTLTIDDPGVMLQGQGRAGTKLLTTDTTNNVITISRGSAVYSHGGIRDLTLYSTGNRTAGYIIHITANMSGGLIDNLQIGLHGGYDLGHGIYFNTTLWTLTNSSLEIPGPFKAIHLDGGNDNYFSKLWLRGDHSNDSGATGIYIQENGGSWFSDIEAVEFYYGIRIRPNAGEDVAWINMHNVLADSNDLKGLQIDPNSGNVYGLNFNSCWFASNGAGVGGVVATINGRGIGLSNAGIDGVYFVNPRVVNNGGHGIEVSNAVDVQINGGLFTGNSQQSPSGTAHGIVMNDNDEWQVNGVRSGQVAGRDNSQGYGLYIGAGCDDFIVTGSNFLTNVTGGISDNSTTTTKIIAKNFGNTVQERSYQFGVWESKNPGTVYLAPTDGFVHAYVTAPNPGDRGGAQLMIDGSNPPTTPRARCSVNDVGTVYIEWASLFGAVMAGEYWRITESDDAGAGVDVTVYWRPLY
uniref:Pectate lyase n=1 Tax=viral metagenome TaxID=1070528 RepID=A0A6M3L167_9ZZZZ